MGVKHSFSISEIRKELIRFKKEHKRQLICLIIWISIITILIILGYFL